MIYIDGGSNTYGDELPDRSVQAWPYLLEKQLDVPVVNAAIQGKSNQHIIFDLINFCSLNKPTFVIIGWVDVSRKMVVRRENNYIVDMSVNGNNSIYHTDSSFNTFRNSFYKYWSNDLYDNWGFLQGVLLVQNFLRSQSIPYLMFNDASQLNLLNLLNISSLDYTAKHSLLDALDTLPDNAIESIEKNFNSLYNLLDHTSYYDFSWCLNKLVKFRSHPTQIDHQIISDFIISITRSRICLK